MKKKKKKIDSLDIPKTLEEFKKRIREQAKKSPSLDKEESMMTYEIRFIPNRKDDKA